MNDDASARSCPIAVVGMAISFPGADGVDALWDALKDGLDTVSEVPPSRFDISHRADAAGNPRPCTNKLYGNFLDRPDSFDNAFFHISPREARSMDPQQRILLRVAYHALENAGYTPGTARSWNPDTFATYVGVATNDYVHNLRNSIDAYYSTGTLQSFMSGKIAYAFGFGGPSLVLDTACSSSIVAVHQACRALQTRDCNAALAGGVNVVTSPDMYVGLSRGHFLSKTGQCRPWDASADGYCRSEGCGLFVLKRLDDALAENDRILGIIRGVEVNQSGNARSITHPHVPTQIALFQKLVASSRVHPHHISVVECHGTGTQAGDPAEMEAIRNVFAVDRTPDNPLHVTSVKANIGHAEAASGAASLAKLILMLRERTIPRHPSFAQLNPRISDLRVDNVRIDTANVPWTPREKRLALLNNFGASGSNAALILEEHSPPPRTVDISPGTGMIVGLACKTVAAAEKLRAAYVTQLEVSDNDAASLHDFAYSTTARRQLHPFRISACGSSKDEVVHALRSSSIVEVHPASGVVFVFSGQGSQYFTMGAGLYRELPFVSKIVDECNQKLVDWGFVTILDVFRASPAPEQSCNPQGLQPLQTALFVLEYALARLWMSWGVHPVAVIGHSFGEFAALVIAGVLTLDDALRLVATRARLISERCPQDMSGMTSVRASIEQLMSLLARTPGLDICCFNATSYQTIGGPINQLQEFEQACAHDGFRSTRLEVPFAYHSAMMDRVLDGLRELGNEVQVSPPKIPILSNVTGTMVQPGDLTVYSPDYFARHCREPARFGPGIVDFQARFDLSEIAVCIEIGPHPTTLPFLRGLQRNSAPLLSPSLRRDMPTLGTLRGTLADLYCTSVPVKWREVFADLAPEARLIDLPPYPFADTRFWVPYEENGSAGSTTRTCGEELGRSSSPATSSASSVEVSCDDLAELIQGHRIVGFPLCPASVYTDVVLAEAVRVFREHGYWGTADALDLADVTIPAPLVHVPEIPRTLLVQVGILPASQRYSGSFKVVSVGMDGDDFKTHCTGFLKRTTLETRTSKLLCARGMVEREIQRTVGAASAETFGTRTVYGLLFPQVVQYGEHYQAIKTITIDSESSSAYAVCHLPRAKFLGVTRRSRSVVDSVFVDSLFHIGGFLINFTSGMNGHDVFVCSEVDKVKVLPGLSDPSALYGVYASVVRVEEGLRVADVFAVDVDDPQRNIRACLKRVQFRRLALSSLKKVLALSSGCPSGDTSIPGDASDGPHHNVPPPVAADPGTLHADIVHIISEISDIPYADISSEAELSKLGIDSVMIWELIARLRPLLSTSAPALDAHLFADATTVRDLVRVVFEQRAPLLWERQESTMLTASESSITLCEKPGNHSDDVAVFNARASNSPRADDDADDVQKLADLCREPITSLEVHASFTRNSGGTPKKGDTANDGVYSIWRLQSSSVSRVESSLTSPLGPSRRSDTGTTPVILIHDGSGQIAGYSKLNPLGRDVWAIKNDDFPATHAFLADDPGKELVALVIGYLDLLMSEFFNSEHGISRECLLGGWSFGGVVAYELARHLLAMGIHVKGLVLIDAPAPQTGNPLPDALIDRVVERVATSHRTAGHLKVQMKCAGRALVGYDPSQSNVDVRNLPAVFLRSREGADVTACGEELDPRVHAFLTKEGDEWTIPQWKAALGEEVEVLDILGDHFGVFDEHNIGDVSEQLKKAIEILLSK